MKKSNLILHCGARAITRAELESIKTPRATDTWKPIPHIRLVQEVERALSQTGMKIVSEAYGVTGEGERMFGILQVSNGCESSKKDYGYVVGLRGSINKSLASGLAVGSSVFVCDNLAFSSEIVFFRKHTPLILRDLPLLVDSAIGQLESRWGQQDERFNAYKETELTNDEAILMTVNASRQDIFPWTAARDIIQEWENPRHPEFKDRNVWSWFNAVTENLKPGEESKASGLWTLPARTGRLHKLCDDASGVKVENN